MSEVRARVLINADIDTVYRVAEDYPLFVDRFREKAIISRDGSNVKVRITNDFFFFPLTWEGEGDKRKNNAIYWKQTAGLLAGLTAEWKFTSQDKKTTEVTIEAKYKRPGFKGKILEFIAPLLISRSAKDILHFLKTTAERTTWTYLKQAV